MHQPAVPVHAACASAITAAAQRCVRYVAAMSVRVIRDATEADAAAIADSVVAIARESEGYSLDPAAVGTAVTAALRDPRLVRYWVAVEGDALRGVIGIAREWSDWRNADYWWIVTVYVAPEARGSDLVAQLVERVVHAASAAAAAELRIYAHPDNARAIRAYERLGFSAWGYRVLAMPVTAATAAPAALSDDELWRAFHERSLPHTAWTHAAHLRVAWLHLARYDLDEAHLRMRAGIVRLNAAHGLVETPQRGYHETLTRVWLILVGAVRRNGTAGDSSSVLAAPGLGRDAPLRYYSRDRLFSAAARAMFVTPDLAELP
jgi:ribosomal protein S18 acetylase RimI-like enzyme